MDRMIFPSFVMPSKVYLPEKVKSDVTQTLVDLGTKAKESFTLYNIPVIPTIENVSKTVTETVTKTQEILSVTNWTEVKYVGYAMLGLIGLVSVAYIIGKVK